MKIQEGWFLTYSYYGMSVGGQTAKISLDSVITETQALEKAQQMWEEEKKTNNDGIRFNKDNPMLIYEKKFSLE